MALIGGEKGLLAAVGVTLLALGLYPTLWQPSSPAVLVATAIIDPVATGSINPVQAPIPADDPRPGSAGFHQALGLIAGKDFAGAYSAATALPDDMERHAIQWAAIYFGDGAVPYDEIEALSKDAPAFVSDDVFQTRLEQSVTRSGTDAATVIKLLGGATPGTIDAQLALAAAYLQSGDTARATSIARAVWVGNFLDAKAESNVLDKFGVLLTPADHWARAVHLMMNDRASAVDRLLKFLTPAQTSLAVARNAVSRNASDAKALLDKVDPSEQDDPVYIFSRAQRARQASLYQSAIDWLAKAKGALPDSELWWYERRTLVRTLLSVGDPQHAYDVAAGYEEGPDGRLVEAHFQAGWIALSFLGDAVTAKGQFEAMRKFATLPDSVTQANYWLGRALLRLNDVGGAQAAFTLAADHGTTYYGLLARDELGLKGAELREMPKWEDAQVAFDASEVIRAVRLLAANGQGTLAEPLLSTYADKLQSGPELLLAARLAQAIDAHHLAISIADMADERGIPLDLFSFPKDGLPSTALAAIDKAAIYAIARQESRFEPDVVSSSGALGLMQLMPDTAKELAAKVGIDYSLARLTDDPSYNALLGSTYLAAQLDRYDGSLLLAAAAYNAGAGNANKWIASFGDPRADHVDPVVWVELIPFQETRKYVQRVLANYLVYRARLGDHEMTIAEALRRIPDQG